MLTTISALMPYVLQAGQIAIQGQKQIMRSFKEDLSVLTEIDQQLDAFLASAILREFPEANLVSEEAKRPWDPAKPYTFTLDPIDGTDSFSQSMPGWCIAIGLLNAMLQPIAGIVYAPQWGPGVLIIADIEKPVTCNSNPLGVLSPEAEITKKSQIMVSSHSHHHIDFRGFPGKVRNIGSGVLHLCGPALHPGIMGSILGPAYIWDYTAGHAIALKAGLTVEYWNGSPLTYHDLVLGQQSQQGYALCGLPANIERLHHFITKRS